MQTLNISWDSGPVVRPWSTFSVSICMVSVTMAPCVDFSLQSALGLGDEVHTSFLYFILAAQLSFSAGLRYWTEAALNGSL